jgi:hypothetical protein
MAGNPFIDAQARRERRDRILARGEKLKQEMKEQERLKGRGYKGPRTITLPTGQTLAEFLVAHPEYPPLASWSLRNDRSVRFAEPVEFDMAVPLDWGGVNG